MRISLLVTLSVLTLGMAAPAYALSPVACTMDAKLCPNGVTYVGRDGNNNCAWQKCPGEIDMCKPYQCNDGTRIDRCAADGTVINYFAAPCLTHGGEVDTSQSFSDVPATHPNAEAISYLKNAGVIEGYPPEYYFHPDQKINRAEFVKVLTVGLNLNENAPTPLGTCTAEEIFPDISPLSWYVSFTCTARRLGFIHGYPDGLFHGDRSINFVETAKILSKAFSLSAQSNETIWYKDYVQALAEMNAIPLSILSFDQSITRGEMAEMIYRLKTGTVDKPSNDYDVIGGGLK